MFFGCGNGFGGYNNGGCGNNNCGCGGGFGYEWLSQIIWIAIIYSIINQIFCGGFLCK